MHIIIFFLFLTSSTVYGKSLPVKTGEQLTNTYTVGIVPQFDSVHLYNVWRPILDYLQQQTGQKFILRGAPDIVHFQQEFLQGKFDFCYMNPYHMLLAHNKQKYQPIIRDISTNLYGIVVVKKNDPIKDVSELQGKILAFPAPNSLGATMMIKKDLLDHYGINIVPLYVQTHNSVYLNVALGLARAGGGVQKTLSQQPQNILNKLRVIHRTEEVVSHPFTVHPRIPKALKIAVGDALLLLGKSAQGRQLLAKIPIKVVGKASIDDYLPISKMNLERFYQP